MNMNQVEMELAVYRTFSTELIDIMRDSYFEGEDLVIPECHVIQFQTIMDSLKALNAP